MVQAQGRTPTTDSAAIGGDVGLFRPSADELEPAISLDGFYEYYFSPWTSVRLGHLVANVDNFGPPNPDGLKLSIGLKQYF